MDLHTTVVSIDRNPELQANLTKALEAADLAHQVFVGQDGVEDVPAALLAHYSGPKTRVRVRGPRATSRARGASTGSGSLTRGQKAPSPRSSR